MGVIRSYRNIGVKLRPARVRLGLSKSVMSLPASSPSQPGEEWIHSYSPLSLQSLPPSPPLLLSLSLTPSLSTEVPWCPGSRRGSFLEESDKMVCPMWRPVKSGKSGPSQIKSELYFINQFTETHDIFCASFPFLWCMARSWDQEGNSSGQKVV